MKRATKPQNKSNTSKQQERSERARKMAKVLHKLFPGRAGTALDFHTPFELLVAVILSAQSTDKRVNIVTKDLFRKYRTIKDYANAGPNEFVEDISSINFRNNKARNIIRSAQIILETYKGKVPQTMDELMSLPGVARKTANAVLSNAFGIIEGIAVDTHVKRFARKFDLTDNTDPDKIEIDLMALLPKSEWFGFHNNLIFYGREICPARPHDCSQHPLTLIYPPAAGRWPSAK